jgi:hypothetical protein
MLTSSILGRNLPKSTTVFIEDFDITRSSTYDIAGGGGFKRGPHLIIS